MSCINALLSDSIPNYIVCRKIIQRPRGGRVLCIHCLMVLKSETSEKIFNEKDNKVEADVAMCPLLSLFRRKENRDGDTYVPYALHNF